MPRVITSIADLRERARRRIPHAIFEYADRGAYDEITLERNRADLDALTFRQRVMVDFSKLDLATTLEYGLYPFVPGDLLKLYLAGALLPGAWRLLGRLRG